MLFSIAGLIVVIGLIIYIYFVKINPDYLRTEDFQLRKQSIEMLGDKDNQQNPQLKNIIHIASPYSRQPNNTDKKIDFGE